MLNTAANHRFIPRDGYNISLLEFQNGLASAINLDPSFSAGPFTALLPYSTTGYNGTLNLHDLAAHNVIEHDGSLSRNDHYSGDSVRYSGAIWSETSATWSGKKCITIEAAREARNARLAAAARRNPTFDLGENGAFNSLGEISQTILFFGQKNVGNARVDWVDDFFREERFPWELGWERSEDRLFLQDVYDMMKKVNETVYCAVMEC